MFDFGKQRVTYGWTRLTKIMAARHQRHHLHIRYPVRGTLYCCEFGNGVKEYMFESTTSESPHLVHIT
jgi:hypothetical protein